MQPNAIASYTRVDDAGDQVADDAKWTHLRPYRYALWSLMLKDFRVRYRNMSLGILWSIINPLVMLGVLVVVFSFIYPNRHAAFFPVFMLIGLVMYNFIAMCIPSACTSISDNASLVKKVIFPRELIPLAAVCSQLVHVVIQFVILMAFVAIFRVDIEWTWLWLPLPYLVMLMFILGTSFACAALNVVYRDVLYVVESALKIWFWLSPVFYDLKQVKLNLPESLYWIYLLNPAAGCIDALRGALLRGESPDPQAFGMATVVSLLVLIYGWRLFVRRQRNFADEL